MVVCSPQGNEILDVANGFLSEVTCLANCLEFKGSSTVMIRLSRQVNIYGLTSFPDY